MDQYPHPHTVVLREKIRDLKKMSSVKSLGEYSRQREQIMLWRRAEGAAAGPEPEDHTKVADRKGEGV
jgi:hypothetical protein